MFNIEEEYKRDKELKREDVQAVMEWTDKQPHLPKMTEHQAILFLQSCYYRNEAAKAALDTYFTVKTLCPDLFLNRNPNVSPLKEGLDVGLFTQLPQKTPEGYTVLFSKFLDHNPDNYNMSAQIKLFDMSTILWLNRNGTSAGHVLCMDFKGVAFGHLAKFGPLTMKKLMYYLQEAMPVRLKALHYFNIVPFMDKILALMKPFMKKEMIDMLYLHNTVDDLCKFIPRECLPQDYGGSVESCAILHEKVKKNILENTAFFEGEDKQLVDESKRPGKPKNAGDFFGVEGTFKKLELD